jgi:hypothetical protein
MNVVEFDVMDVPSRASTERKNKLASPLRALQLFVFYLQLTNTNGCVKLVDIDTKDRCAQHRCFVSIGRRESGIPINP